MKKVIQIDSWKRKAQFNFFKDFGNPFFSLVSNIECTESVDYCKENKISFFLWYLHHSMKAANEIEEFKYRYDGSEVVVYDKVNATPTIARADETFGFSYIEYVDDFEKFNRLAIIEIERVKNEVGLKPATDNENVIHCSSIPWLSFTGISHPLSMKVYDSCPKISFGKTFAQDHKTMMPVSVHANHALMDGLHVSRFFEKFEYYLKNP